MLCGRLTLLLYIIDYTYSQSYIPKAHLRKRDGQTADNECFMRIRGTSGRYHGFSFFIDNLLVPHHAFGKGK